MKLNICLSDGTALPEGFEKIIQFTKGKGLYANSCDANIAIEIGSGRHVYLYGDVFYHIKRDGRIGLIDSNNKKYLKNLFSEYKLEDIIPKLEGQYVGIYLDDSKKVARIFSDRYARLDTFYSNDKGDFYFATDLNFIFKYIRPEYDQKMLAHLFSVFGWYAPKGLTIYKNVKRLRVGEIVSISGAGMRSTTIEFEPLKIEEYTDSDLNNYYKILRESVTARANRKGATWVSSSSGWDSSILLGMLVNEFGSKDIRMISGSMQYSKETDVINKFEIDKIKKIGDFYGIKPVIVNFDYKSKKAAAYLEKLMPYYKSRHVYVMVLNLSTLSDELARNAGKGQTIFNGETSDSFHNFGFSQFATFFHTKKSFTEYADKMNCYLYGPSFFKKVLNGSFEKDRVFQIFKKMAGDTEFACQWKNRKDIIESYMFPFFHGSPRLPFAQTNSNQILTKKGQMAVYAFPYREYMPEVLTDLSEDNLYSWFIYLYHSFHSQGSTVNIHRHAMDYNSHRHRAPFNDYRMIEFLSKAPEKWGRGLELNNTKYPLKWVALNKIKFPYEILDEGPHSYLYDVIEGFSLAAEVAYRSGVSDLLKARLKDRPYRAILDSEYFDIGYLDKLVSDYLNGKEASGKDFNNLYSLITFCMTGWY